MVFCWLLGEKGPESSEDGHGEAGANGDPVYEVLEVVDYDDGEWRLISGLVSVL